ncbi:hypothetical protein [Apilactobacillus xinyiensis]|uniref:Uncharacterized protein n=1 Tax=Apilactobacillus xinyiensis TaxID=2841032 RepID=A0ABT0I1H4_9LACO|nr:hypothetical protein [Apilactobacillus xinyiensis]MCK8624571.1 hypothetical protein [Apilactobacillus xinyiensis]MCL0312463.1 hypothetical protein [Apilactobacillus xinyiensis]MCL0318566.1 hypothetical protein [Apilactobacillus xinyiensis]
MNEILNEFSQMWHQSGSLAFIGFVLAILGVCIVGVGKKIPLIRYMLGDRSMIAQIFWGTIIAFVGFAMIYLFR